MIDLERLKRVTIIVAHANCPDGVASALVLRDALPDAAAVFAQYGASEFLELPAKTGMLFCDIAPPESRAAQFLECGAIVLDHHKTARSVVERFVEVGLGAFADEAAEPGVSGAVLAFREAWVPLVRGECSLEGFRKREERAERFAAIAGVRDTWQKQHALWPEAREQAEALRFWPFDRWPHVDIFGENSSRVGEMLSIGRVLVERQDATARRLVAQGKRLLSDKGTRVLVIPSRETSDAADLATEFDLVVGFSFTVDAARAKMIVSLRSHGAFDCAALARANGGGGHTNAAGFEVTLMAGDPHPYAMVETIVGYFERTGDGIVP